MEYINILVPALGDFDEPQRSSITMFGVLTIAVRIYQDRWGYGIYSGPIGSAVFIITVKWVSRLRKPAYFLFFSMLSKFSFIPSLISFISSTSKSPPLVLYFFFLSFQLLFHLLSLDPLNHFLSPPSYAPFSFLTPSNRSLGNFECDYSAEIIAISAAEDEAAEGGVSREDSLHAAGRSRLLLRCPRSDAAFLFWGDNQIITNPKTQISQDHE